MRVGFRWSPPKPPSQQEAARAALSVAQRNGLGRIAGTRDVGAFVFQHIRDQDALFKRIVGSHKASSIVPHSAAAVPSWYGSGKDKGLLMDTGAVRLLTGAAFVDSQVAGMVAHGFDAIWTTLPKPEFTSGVGKGAQRCTRRVNLVGALLDGGLLAYEAPVLDVDVCPESAGVPLLYGLDLLDRDNALFDSRDGVIYCFPAGFKASSLSWPKGTRELHCERSSGGHWLLGVDHWDRADPAELRQVRAIRSKARLE